MRRFEQVSGNKARYWEIERNGPVIVTRQGAIGKQVEPKQSHFPDYMAAEVAFDRLIHEKLRKGFKEVREASGPQTPFAERPLDLVPLDGSPTQSFDGPAMKYLLWRMVECSIMDRQRQAPDLERWGYRAMRQLRLDDVPAPGDSSYDEWNSRRLEISARERAAPMNGHQVGCFKFREGSHWIVTPEECTFIAAEAANRMPKRRKDKATEAAWLQSWVDFHSRAAKTGGYTVVAK